MRQLRAALAQVLLKSGRASSELEAAVFAGALTAAIDAALDRWLDGDGREPLPRCFTRAFACLDRLTAR